MKQARYKEPLPLAVIEAARAGDAGAVEQVLQYYNGYINKLCTRTLYDDCGQLHVCVDEYMKHRLENKLIHDCKCMTGRYNPVFSFHSLSLVLQSLLFHKHSPEKKWSLCCVFHVCHQPSLIQTRQVVYLT